MLKSLVMTMTLSMLTSVSLRYFKAIWEELEYIFILLWQPLITKTNDHTNGKSLNGISSGEFTRELDKESLLN